MEEKHSLGRKAIDLTGQKFGKLKVLRFLERRKKKLTWLCLCDCGVETACRSSDLRHGNILSCGCLRDEASRLTHFVHGGTVNYTSTQEYGCWLNMRRRCREQSNKHYARYGGRGITVCDRWLNSFENFLADMGPSPSPEHSIDRINNDGNYEPGNCRWATQLDQARNKTNNRVITAYGRTMCLQEWSEFTGLHRDTIRRRMNRGMSAEMALVR